MLEMIGRFLKAALAMYLETMARLYMMAVGAALVVVGQVMGKLPFESNGKELGTRMIEQPILALWYQPIWFYVAMVTCLLFLAWVHRSLAGHIFQELARD